MEEEVENESFTVNFRGDRNCHGGDRCVVRKNIEMIVIDEAIRINLISYIKIVDVIGNLEFFHASVIDQTRFRKWLVRERDRITPRHNEEMNLISNLTCFQNEMEDTWFNFTMNGADERFCTIIWSSLEWI